MSRIAYLLGSFPVISETFIGNEIRAMEAKGHQIFPIALHHPQADFQPEDKAIADRTLYFFAIDPQEAKKLVRRHLFRLPRLLPFLLAQTTEPSYPLAVHAAHLAEYIEEKECTHIHAHFAWGAATYAIAAAKLLNLPVTLTCHGSDVYARPVDLALKCKSATAVFAVAPSLAADVQRLAPHTPCHTVYCGVDANCFKPGDISRKHGRWLFCGRLIDCKGITDILEAWLLIPEQRRPRFDIVGDGPLKEKLVSFVTQNALEEYISFLGTKTSTWLAENGPYYHAFISAFREGCDGSKDTAPLALKEAMAMALPVVTTDFRDIPHLVGNECALLCPASSPSAIASAVMRMDAMPPKMLEAMGKAGRTRTEKHYSLQQQAEQITELFDFYKKRW